tara:strand:- start:612 stop:794 length:183 start_codon:yes stop_codon:yes gene_type:complete
MKCRLSQEELLHDHNTNFVDRSEKPLDELAEDDNDTVNQFKQLSGRNIFEVKDNKIVWNV